MNFAEFKKTGDTWKYLEKSKSMKKALNCCVVRWELLFDDEYSVDCGFCIVSHNIFKDFNYCCVCPVEKLCLTYSSGEVTEGELLGALYYLQKNPEYLK